MQSSGHCPPRKIFKWSSRKVHWSIVLVIVHIHSIIFFLWGSLWLDSQDRLRHTQKIGTKTVSRNQMGVALLTPAQAVLWPTPHTASLTLRITIQGIRRTSRYSDDYCVFRFGFSTFKFSMYDSLASEMFTVLSLYSRMLLVGFSLLLELNEDLIWIEKTYITSILTGRFKLISVKLGAWWNPPSELKRFPSALWDWLTNSQSSVFNSLGRFLDPIRTRN